MERHFEGARKICRGLSEEIRKTPGELLSAPERKEEMNLQEAIDNAKKVSQTETLNRAVKESHKQLAAWLEELQQLRKENEELKEKLCQNK